MTCWNWFCAKRVATCRPMPGPDPNRTKVLDDVGDIFGGLEAVDRRVECSTVGDVA